jgi:hypothetical protein
LIVFFGVLQVGWLVADRVVCWLFGGIVLFNFFGGVAQDPVDLMNCVSFFY